MNKPVIDSRLLVAIRDYQHHVAKAVERLEAGGILPPTSNDEWATRRIPQSGKLRDGSRYFKHGYGCRFRAGRWIIEWDFGDAGQIDRFDAHWLWDWIAVQKRGLFRSKGEYWTILRAAILAGLVNQDRSGLYELNHHSSGSSAESV